MLWRGGCDVVCSRCGVWCVVDMAGVDVACRWRGRRGVVVNAHIPQHEGRGKEIGGEGWWWEREK